MESFLFSDCSGHSGHIDDTNEIYITEISLTTQRHSPAARFRRKCFVAGKTARVLAENTPGRAKRPAFSVKTRRDEQNAPRFRQKHAEASKTARVLTENAPRRAKRPAFSPTTRRGGQNGSRFDGKCAVASKTSRVLTENTPWRAKRLSRQATSS